MISVSGLSFSPILRLSQDQQFTDRSALTSVDHNIIYSIGKGFAPSVIQRKRDIGSWRNFRIDRFLRFPERQGEKLNLHGRDTQKSRQPDLDRDGAIDGVGINDWHGQGHGSQGQCDRGAVGESKGIGRNSRSSVSECVSAGGRISVSKGRCRGQSHRGGQRIGRSVSKGRTVR